MKNFEAGGDNTDCNQILDYEVYDPIPGNPSPLDTLDYYASSWTADNDNVQLVYKSYAFESDSDGLTIM